MLHVFSSERCLRHDPVGDFPERPERLSGTLRHLAAEGFEIRAVDGHPEARGAVGRIHAADYVERFRRAVERGDGLFDSADNPIGPESWGAAWAAVEVSLAAADWMMGSTDSEPEGPGADDRRIAFAAVRPPGHHAEVALAMGFCFFNNAAVAAEYLLSHHGCERVAIFDSDVHHGNGTQHIFEHRPEVLYASTHQYPFYPGTGAATERGRGEGEGATVNAPLPASSGDAAYAGAFSEIIVPALRAFAPDALVLSAGFDAWKSDPLGGMEVTEEGFSAWGSQLGELAAEICGGRLLVLLEGGYDLEALPRLVEIHLRGLHGGVMGSEARPPAGEGVAD